jgi:hypothetical protein
MAEEPEIRRNVVKLHLCSDIVLTILSVHER